MSRALSPGEEPERGASWIEGFIGTSGLVLVHDPDLLAVLDDWIATASPPTPSPTSSHCCAARSPSCPPASAAASASACAARGRPLGGELDSERAAPALATVARLLGA